MTTAIKETPQQAPVPRRLSDVPEYAAAERRLGELQNKRNEAQRRIDAIEAGLSACTTAAQSKRAAAAMAMLEGVDNAAGELNPEALRGELAAIREQRAVATMAVEMQGRILGDMARRFSRRVCEPYKPAYAALVKRMARAAVELGTVQAEMKAMHDMLQEGGVQFLGELPPVGIRGEWDPRESYSLVCMFIREFVAHGFLDRNDPLVKQTSAISGGEDFLPEVKARREKEEAARRQEEEDRQQQRRKSSEKGQSENIVHRVLRQAGALPSGWAAPK